jgi:hypothetical protein
MTIAHDRAEHDRINGILTALRLPEARDEMGIGGIRDTLADAMFPGTTTVQTRIEYLLFVPWCYPRPPTTRCAISSPGLPERTACEPSVGIASVG